MMRIFRFGRTRNIAKDRLKILLISDRVNCSPRTMELIRDDIAKVLSQYMKIDEAQMEIQIRQANEDSRREKKPMLYVNIPIIDLRSEQTIC